MRARIRTGDFAIAFRMGAGNSVQLIRCTYDKKGKSTLTPSPVTLPVGRRLNSFRRWSETMNYHTLPLTGIFC